MDDYEKKLAMKSAKLHIREAMTDWKRYNISIDSVLERMGYTKEGLYKFKKNYRVHMKVFTICLDTYKLLTGSDSTIEVEVTE